MDGTVHATAAEQRRVGRVDDGIDALLGDVALHELQPCGAEPELLHGS
jgi:hypothetical protein